MIRDIDGLCGLKGMIRVCLNIDSDPGRKGQVLSVTDPTSDLTLEYKTKLVSQKEFANYASEMKIEYQNPDLRFISPAFFGAILTDASKITVCANAPILRYPSGCSYDFEYSRKPQIGCGLPMNFDYGAVFYMTQTSLPASISHLSIMGALAQVRRESCREGFGHPGITSDGVFMEQLVKASCTEIEDDVLKTPYYDEWKLGRRIDPEHWSPVLREDGFIGIFRDDSDAALKQEQISGVAKYYIVAYNALAYFACDQLRVLLETNAKDWTWEEWKNSTEVRRAGELSSLVAATVCERMMIALDALEDVHDGGGVPVPYKKSGRSARPVSKLMPCKHTLKQTKPPLITTFNIFNADPLKIDPGTISFEDNFHAQSCARALRNVCRCPSSAAVVHYLTTPPGDRAPAPTATSPGARPEQRKCMLVTCKRRRRVWRAHIALGNKKCSCVLCCR